MTPLTKDSTAHETESMLSCPSCGHNHQLQGIHTHITAVTVYAHQEHKDGTRVHVVTNTANNVTVTPVEARHMPGDRHTVTLQIWCEECDQTTDLVFRQHKGTTYVTSKPKNITR